jgi:hypothetical protein
MRLRWRRRTDIEPRVEIHIRHDQTPPAWYRPGYDTLVRHLGPDPALWNKIPDTIEADILMVDPYNSTRHPHTEEQT